MYWAYSSHDSYPSKLASRRDCDLILGVTADDRFAQRVLYSRPYYVAKYQLVVRTGQGAPAAEELLGSKKAWRFIALRGESCRAFPDTEAILEAVAEGRLRAGYVISTRAPWLAYKRWQEQLIFLPAAENVDCFPIRAAVAKIRSRLKGGG